MRVNANAIGSVRRVIDSESMLDGARPRTLSDMLKARGPGISVARQGGDPSNGSRIRLRGATSVRADAAPAVVIDGIVVDASEELGSDFAAVASSRFDDFEPEEIDQIEILPGPAATTLFGAGASRGAIVVTTRRGTSGKPLWRIWTTGAQSVDHTDYPTNYRQRGTNLSNGAEMTCSVIQQANQQCVPTVLDSWNPLEGASPFRTGMHAGAGGSVTGGPVGITSYASVAGRMERGVLADASASRLNGRLNLEARNLATFTRFPGPDPEVALVSEPFTSIEASSVPALPRTVALRIDVGGH